MGYITSSTHIISLLVTNICQILAITSRFEHEASPSRNFRRHIGTLPFPDWELGLREAVYQALLRERNLHPNLREYLHSAPLLGRQDSATPFGDIAILARGQLYSAPGGFQFAQDPYQNDCEGCHNPPPQCGRVACDKWRPQDHERLLALWTVKRIRHRDTNYGYRYELEYKITPMSGVASEPFTTRNGNFDYSVPGHTFIVKTDPRQSDPNFQRLNVYPDKVHGSSDPYYNSDHWSPTYGGPNFDAHYLPPPPPVIEEYYDEDLHGRPQDPNRYQNVLFGPPETQTKKPSQAQYPTKVPLGYDPKETELYKNLIETLSSKTSTTRNAQLTTTSTQQPFEFELFPQSPSPRQMTTQTSPQPTSYTTSQLSSPTTSTLSYIRPTSSQTPILPTIPLQTSTDTASFLEDISSTKKMRDIYVTRPQFTSTMIRFPTTTSSRLKTTDRTSTTRFSESTRYIKYSEPDPLYTTTITPTLPTITSKPFTTRTTKLYKPSTQRYKTTENIDLELFGDNQSVSTTKTTTKNYEKTKFSNFDHANVEPGEQVITVVNPPNIPSQISAENEKPVHVIQPVKPETSPHKYNIDFSNTQQLPPEGESYITITVSPSTRIQQYSTPAITASTESSVRYKPTSRRISTKGSSTKTSSTTDDIKLISTTDMNRSIESSTQFEPTNTDAASTKTTATLIKTFLASRKTTPFIYKTSTKMRTPPTNVIATKRTMPTKPVTRTSATIKTNTPSTTMTTLKTTEKLPPFLSTMPTMSESTETTTSEHTTDITTIPGKTFPPVTAETTVVSETETIRSASTKFINISDFTTHPSELSTTSEDYSTLISDAPKTTTLLYQLPTKQANTKSTLTTSQTILPTSTIKTTTRVLEIPMEITSRSASSTTTPIQKTSPSRHTTTDDFLGDIPKKEKMKFQEENFELDIFGKPQENQTSKSDKQSDKHKKPVNSKEIDDIFSSKYDNKQSALHDNGDYTDDYRTTKKPKIIFSNFYSPSTALDKTTGNVTQSLTATEAVKNKTNGSKPSSSKRQGTSKGMEEKNTNNITNDFLSDIEFEPTIKAILKETHPKKSEYKVYKAEFPETTTPSDKHSVLNDDVDNNKIFDALTLSVVNHARSIDYLSSNNNCSTAKEQKYKRRSTYRVRKLRRRN